MDRVVDQSSPFSSRLEGGSARLGMKSILSLQATLAVGRGGQIGVCVFKYINA